MKKIMILLAASFCISANAKPVRWELSNFVYNDGGQATGSFVFDADTGIVSDIDIVTSGGTSGIAGFSYNSLSTGGPGVTDSDKLFAAVNGASDVGDPVLNIVWTASLTNAGGTVNVFHSEVLIPTPGVVPTVTRFGSATIISAIPLPGAAILYSSTLGLLCWFRRRRIIRADD